MIAALIFDNIDPMTWVFLIMLIWVVGSFIVLFFFPNGLTKKDKERNLTEAEYQKWLQSRTGETWDQKKES